jgi:hypothetical protein
LVLQLGEFFLELCVLFPKGLNCLHSLPHGAWHAARHACGRGSSPVHFDTGATICLAAHRRAVLRVATT